MRPSMKSASLPGRFFSDERGTETVEWGIIAGLLFVGLVLTLVSIGAWMKGAFEQVKADVGA